MTVRSTTLLALDEQTGVTIWSADVTNIARTAYDSGKVFVVDFDGLMKAFDAANGTLLWSVNLPGQYAFTLLQPPSMQLCLQAAPETVELFMQAMKRMWQCFGG